MFHPDAIIVQVHYPNVGARDGVSMAQVDYPDVGARHGVSMTQVDYPDVGARHGVPPDTPPVKSC